MEVFWLCEQCDSTNDYEATKVCSVCGWKIDPKSEEKCIYELAGQLEEKAVTSEALFAVCAHYLKIITYKDARQKHSQCQFKAEKALLNEKVYAEAVRHLKSAEAYCAEKEWEAAICEYKEAEQAFQKAAGYADAGERAQACKREAELCRTREAYFAAKEILVSAASIADYKKAAEMFLKISFFSDAKENYELCLRFIKELTARKALQTATEQYRAALKAETHHIRLQSLEQILQEHQAYLQAAEFMQLFADCKAQIKESQKYVDYDLAVDLLQKSVAPEELKKAADIFSRLGSFRDSSEKQKLCAEKSARLEQELAYKKALESYEQGKHINIFNWKKYF